MDANEQTIPVQKTDDALTTFAKLPFPASDRFGRPWVDLVGFLEAWGNRLVAAAVRGVAPPLAQAALDLPNGREILTELKSARILPANGPTPPQAAAPVNKNWLKMETSDIIARRKALAVWPAILQRRILETFSRPAGLPLPEDLLALAGTCAWGSATFQLTFACAVRSRLKSEVLFSPHRPGEPEWLPTVNPMTVWALIGILPLFAAEETPKRRSPEAETAVTAVAGIQGMAAKIVQQKGWARFWDQWVIRNVFASGKGPLTAQLARLPYINAGNEAQSAASGETESNSISGEMFAVHNWRDGLPGFLSEHFALKHDAP